MIKWNETTVIREDTTTNSSNNSYVICNNPLNSPFVNPSIKGKAHNKWPIRSTTPAFILTLIVLLDDLFISWWLFPIVCQWFWSDRVPLSIKRRITFIAWYWYVRVHTILICNQLGFYNTNTSDSSSSSSISTISDEYKALSTLLYPLQFFKVTIERMRFGLSQLNTISLRDIPSEDYVERVTYEFTIHHDIDTNDDDDDDGDNNDNDNNSNDDNDDDKNENDTFSAAAARYHPSMLSSNIPQSQLDHCTVQGLYVRRPGHNKSGDEDKTNTNRNCNGNVRDDGPKTTKKSSKENNNVNTDTTTTNVVLFWIYGGAYLSGDAEGNLSLANEFLMDCNGHSVFIPQYRLAPEANIDDVLWDVCLAYLYLLTKLQQQTDNDNDENKSKNNSKIQDRYKIIIVGISSGGALALRLLQLIRDRSLNTSSFQDSSSNSSNQNNKKSLMPSLLEPVIDEIVAKTDNLNVTISGAVLFGPYVDYRDPLPSSNKSFLQNSQYDLIVNEAVQYYGLPHLNAFIPPTNEDKDHDDDDDYNNINKSNNNNKVHNTNGRVLYSPITHDMNDLPPLCLIVSEHETTYDMTIEVVNKLRWQQGKTDAGEGNEKIERDKNSNNKRSDDNNDDNSTILITNNNDVTIGIWKHMCHVFSMMQALIPEGRQSINFAKEWIRTKTN